MMRYSFQPKLIPSLVTLVIFSALLNLAFWQLNRAEFKQLLKTQYMQRNEIMIDAAALANANKDLQFYKVELFGTFDNQHNILVDNKIFQHQIGYEIITPFIIFGSEKIILVDRGWIAQGASRNQLPAIEPVFGEQVLHGTLRQIDQKGLQLGNADDNTQQQWPWRIQKIDATLISKTLNQSLYPYVVIEEGNAVPENNLRPEKHVAYAVQWFALALALLILYFFASFKRKE